MAKTQVPGRQIADGSNGVDLTVDVTGVLPTANGGWDRTATETQTNKTLTNPNINNYTEGVVAIGTVTSSNTISLTNGTMQSVTLTSATPCTFTMPTAAAGKSFLLAVRQPASGTPTTATFTSVKWSASGAPVITPTVGKCDLFSFVCYDGTNWYGSVAQGYAY